MSYDHWKTTNPADEELGSQLQPGQDDEGEPICPVCSGDGGYMGALGNRSWFRCQSCGLEFSREAE